MKTAEELEKEWWDRWWQKDFSWNGLATNGNKFLTPNLQEFWAAEATQLIEDPTDPIADPDKRRRFTKFHLPFYWSNGMPTPKLGWPEAKHLQLKEELERLWRQSEGEVRFDGIVVSKVPMPPKTEGGKDQVPTAFFNHAWLKPGTDWSGTTFGRALFLYALWSGPSQLTGTEFQGDVGFNGAKLTGQTYFKDATFLGDAIFHTTDFSGTALFNEASFHSNVWFDHATFHGSVYFNNTKFLGDFDCGHSLRFLNVDFFEDLIFNPTAIPNDHRFSSGAFNGSKVTRLAYIESPQFRSFAAFHGMEVERKMEASDKVLLNDSLLHSVVNETARLPVYEPTPTDTDDNRWVRELAGGARTFEGAMKAAGNQEAARWFRRMELLAQRFHSNTGPSTRLLTNIYEVSSKFGSSITRPVGLLIFFWLFCASIYWVNSFNLGPDCRQPFAATCQWERAAANIVPALTFSANSTFRPAYAIAREERTASNFQRQILFGKGWTGGLRAALLGTLSTLQSLFSIVMLFLTGLAARRRFQLS